MSNTNQKPSFNQSCSALLRAAETNNRASLNLALAGAYDGLSRRLMKKAWAGAKRNLYPACVVPDLVADTIARVVATPPRPVAGLADEQAVIGYAFSTMRHLVFETTGRSAGRRAMADAQNIDAPGLGDAIAEGAPNPETRAIHRDLLRKAEKAASELGSRALEVIESWPTRRRPTTSPPPLGAPGGRSSTSGPPSVAGWSRHSPGA
jgi:hypothetical protein